MYIICLDRVSNPFRRTTFIRTESNEPTKYDHFSSLNRLSEISLLERNEAKRDCLFPDYGFSKSDVFLIEISLS